MELGVWSGLDRVLPAVLLGLGTPVRILFFLLLLLPWRRIHHNRDFQRDCASKERERERESNLKLERGAEILAQDSNKDE